MDNKAQDRPLDPSIIQRWIEPTPDNEERYEAYRLRLRHWLKNQRSEEQASSATASLIAEEKADTTNTISMALRRKQ